MKTRKQSALTKPISLLSANIEDIKLYKQLRNIGKDMLNYEEPFYKKYVLLI